MFSIQTEIFKFQIFKNGHQINYFQLNNEAEVIYNGKNKERSQIPKKKKKGNMVKLSMMSSYVDILHTIKNYIYKDF